MKDVDGSDPTRETEELYGSLVLALDDGVILHAADGSISESNAAAAAILGLTPDQLAGRTPYDPTWYVIREDGSPFPGDEHPHMVSLRTGRPCRHVLMGVARPSGELRWVRVNAQPLQHAGESRPHGAVTSLVDVTAARAAEQTLRRSEAYFRSLIEHASDVFAIVDRTGRLCYASPAFTPVLGWRPSALDGRNLLHLVHPDELAHAAKAFAATARTPGVREPIELRIRRGDGSYAVMEIIANNLLDEPAVAGIVLTARDLTARRRTEEALRTTTSRLRTLIDSLPSGVLVEDLSGTITLSNARFAEIFWPGGAPPSIAAAAADEIIATLSMLCADPPGFVGRVGDLRSRDEPVLGDEVDLADGRCVQRDFLPISAEGEVRERVWVFRDITASKQAEAAIAMARDAALDASRAKSQFLAALSHEVRTPMNAIIGMVDLLLGMPLEEDIHDLVGGVRSAADSLMGVLNDILDLARIEAGRIEIVDVEFDPLSIIEEAAQTLGAQAQQKNLFLTTGAGEGMPSVVIGDAGRLRQILLNLIGNALKFTDAGEVSVVARAEQRDGRFRLSVEVVDTGVGFDMEVAHTLFEPFTQARPIATRSQTGSGLGLAICRRLLELMHGSISVVSEPGAGSTFSFSVEFGIVDRDRPGPSDPLPASVLLLGLPAHTAAALAMTLRAAGVTVTIAAPDAEPLPRCDVVLVAPSALASGHDLALPAPTRVIAVGPGMSVAREGIDMLALPVSRDRLLRVLSDTHETAPTRRATAEAPLRGRVLLVEDNKVNLGIETRMLEGLGVDVDTATDGAAAIAAVKAHPPDVVLMDCFMPDIDGFEATRRIRADETAGSRVPIIALTASAMVDDRERCVAAGMDGYITKPVIGAELRAALEPWLAAADHEPVDRGTLAALADELEGGGVLIGVIGIYLRELPDRLRVIAAAAESGDNAQVRATAHTLRSSSAALGAHRLAAMCTRLEARAHAGEGDLLADARALCVEATAVQAALVAARDALAATA